MTDDLPREPSLTLVASATMSSMFLPPVGAGIGVWMICHPDYRLIGALVIVSSALFAAMYLTHLGA